jgi:excisionase family DNA binding protein
MKSYVAKRQAVKRQIVARRNLLKSFTVLWHDGVQMEDELLTVDQGAKRLKIHRVTLRKMLREGSIKGMKFGAREWRIPESALQEFIASKMGKSATTKAE